MKSRKIEHELFCFVTKLGKRMKMIGYLLNLTVVIMILIIKKIFIFQII